MTYLGVELDTVALLESTHSATRHPCIGSVKNPY